MPASASRRPRDSPSPARGQSPRPQALLDLDAWVARGDQPPATSGYHISPDNQVQLAATPGQRHGVQPVVTLTADARGAEPAAGSITVRAGQPVTLTAAAADPRDAGEITRIEWDYTGAGAFPVSQRPRHVAAVIRADGRYTFTRPDTYYAYVRVTSQQDGNPDTPYGQVQNLAGIQVIVR